LREKIDKNKWKLIIHFNQADFRNRDNFSKNFPKIDY